MCLLSFLRRCSAAEASGWYGVWLADHYMPDTGDTTPARGDVYECWALLPAVAAVTDRIRIGTLVSPTSVHHPALLVNRAARSTSCRRAGPRIGAGWQINDTMPTASNSNRRASGSAGSRRRSPIVGSLLAEDSTTFHGEFYDITDAPCDPKPVQSPLPLLVGTKRPGMLRITARHASEWNTWAGPGPGRPLPRRCCEACEQTGRDPATMWTSVNALIDLDGSDPPSGRTPWPGRPSS